MSKYANPGELRTPVYIKKIDRSRDADGFPQETETSVFGQELPAYVKWVNVHGTDALTAMQMKLRDPATLTMRYSPLIDQTCLIYRGEDPEAFEIISIDNVEERNTWLEIKVQRRVAAK